MASFGAKLVYQMKLPLFVRALLMLSCILKLLSGQPAADSAPGAVTPETAFQTASVVLDGETIFRVRGVSAYPAETRARAISDRIRTFADTKLPISALRIVEEEGLLRITGGDIFIAAITEPDAAAEGVSQALLARAAVGRIGAAVQAYREARSAGALMRSTVRTVAATAGLAVVFAVLIVIFRKLRKATDDFCRARIEKLNIRALRVVEAERLAASFQSGLRLVHAAAVLFALLVYLNIVLALFPWTRPLSQRVLDLILDPIRQIALGILDFLPNLAFLIILALVVRYLLRLQRTVCNSIRHGTLTFAGFDPDWAEPTYGILRLLTIGFALVVAYPYLPGSGSEALKGVSIFAGLVFSLASSSSLANSVAGYALRYRRTYKVGDRVQVGEVIGDVQEIGAQVTHIRSVKNEEVILPNSQVINTPVVNYSSLAQTHGLILHTTVGIGYETPWRQVEGMLILAASRTPGLLSDPQPFVHHKLLGDFAVTYELNVYCNEPQAQMKLYTELHRNILDVFNEYGVQIMTPAYESDPPEPKLVPENKWYERPARRETAEIRKPAGAGE
jgi:small-conductance mechanosensitive channel